MQALDLNGTWNFAFAEGKYLEEIDELTFPGTGWMSVPGCFDACPATYCKRGTAVYRREFILDEDVCGAFLKIEGMGLRSRFRIDGREIGTSALPYSEFELATGPLSAGKHCIAAAVDNMFDPERMKLFLPNYDFYAFGGFYHGVSLRLMKHESMINRIQIRTLDYKTGRIRLTFLFHGATPDKFSVTLQFDTEISPRTFEVVNQQLELNLPDFRNWSPENPCMHTLSADFNGERHTEHFGVREIRAERKHLFLNGRELYLKGFNRHESHLEFGAATPEQLMITDLQHLRELNCNFVRGCHYPQSQRFLDLCDRFGILVWEESLGWGNTETQVADPQFIRLQIEQTRRMVQNSFNHPSVIIFAFLNEYDSGCPAGDEIARQLCETIRAEDSGRLVTYACARVDSDTSCKYVDLISYNTYPGWIAMDSMQEPVENILTNREAIVARFRKLFDNDKPIIVSEMGCCGIYGQHDEAAAQWTEEFQAEYLDAVIRDVFADEEIRGLTLWQMNDAKSYLRKGACIRTKPLAQNLAGVYDNYRRPKLAAAVVRKLFAEKNRGLI